MKKSILTINLCLVLTLSIVTGKFTIARNFESDEQVITRLKKSLNLEPGKAFTYFQIGWHYQKMGFDKNAKIYYEQCISINKQFVSAWINLGNIYKKEKAVKKALLHYKQALKLKPKSANANYNIGTLYLHTNNEKLARVHLLRAVATRKELVSGYLNLSTIHLRWFQRNKKSQDLYLARKYLKKILYLDNTHPSALYNLGRLYEIEHDYNNALMFYRKCLQYSKRGKRYRKNAIKRIQSIMQYLKK